MLLDRMQYSDLGSFAVMQLLRDTNSEVRLNIIAKLQSINEVSRSRSPHRLPGIHPSSTLKRSLHGCGR